MILNDWMNSDTFNNMDALKVELIKKAAMQTQGKSGNSLVPIMMSLITNANKQGIRFTSEEVSLLVDAMKEGKSKQEQERIDQTMNMVKTVMKNNMK